MRRGLLVVLLLLIIIGIVAFIVARREQRATGDGAVPPGDAAKPAPIARSFMGCPPSGSGGDPVLNTLKNRIDEGQWQPATIQDLLAIPWPKEVENRPRSRWSALDQEAIAVYEGTPVQVEGYLADAKKMSPESANCHSVEYVDYHLWLVDDPAKGREQSVVIETTPRVQIYHPEWTLQRLRQIARSKERVRISGWLMLDPEHPDQVGKTRGTIWEIHPIMHIETRLLGQWVPLDNGSTGVSSAASVSQVLPPVTPAETATQPPPSDQNVQHNQSVQITNIFYDGVEGTSEPDEYVEITNTGSEPVDMSGWEVQDVTGNSEFRWEEFVLEPGATIRVYTNEVHPESGGFSFGSPRAIWANRGDVAELYDLDKQLVSRYAYGNQR